MKPLTESDIAPLWNAEIGQSTAAALHLAFTLEPQARFANAILSKFGGGLSEGEVRERERRAWNCAVEFVERPGDTGARGLHLLAAAMRREIAVDTEVLDEAEREAARAEGR